MTKKRINVDENTFNKILIEAKSNGYTGNENSIVQEYVTSGYDTIIDTKDKTIAEYEKNLQELKNKKCIELSELDTQRMQKLQILNVVDSDTNIAISEMLEFYIQNKKDEIANKIENI